MFHGGNSKDCAWPGLTPGLYPARREELWQTYKQYLMMLQTGVPISGGDNLFLGT